jgi:hypothetical protein
MDPLNLIINALIERGGIWGVIASALFFWNIHKETSLSKKENKTQDSIKIIQENTEKKEKDLKEVFEKKEKDLREKIEDLEKIINNQQETINRLTRDICDLESARVEDLKELLSEYHTTASATLQALEKFEFFIKNSKRA